MTAEVELTGMTLARYGPFAHTYIPLDRGVTVLFGRNGSGKSMALDMLAAALEALFAATGDPTAREGRERRVAAAIDRASEEYASWTFSPDEARTPDPSARVHLRTKSSSAFDRIITNQGSPHRLAVWGGLGSQPLREALARGGRFASQPSRHQRGTFLLVPTVVCDELDEMSREEWSSAQDAYRRARQLGLGFGEYSDPDEIVDRADAGLAEPSVLEAEPVVNEFEPIPVINSAFDAVTGGDRLNGTVIVVDIDPDLRALDAETNLLAAVRILDLPPGVVRGRSRTDVRTTVSRMVGKARWPDRDVELDDFLSELGEVASQYAGLVLADRLVLRVVAETLPWVMVNDSPPLRWQARDPNRGCWVDLDNLSQTQRRWAAFGIARALADQVSPRPPLERDFTIQDGSETQAKLARELYEEELAGYEAAERQATVVIIDEPELGLDDLSLFNLAVNLELLGDWVVVSTHSPTILRSQERVLLFAPDQITGSVDVTPVRQVHRVEEPLGSSAQSRYGLRPATEISLARVLVAVEGQHDSLILGRLLQGVLTETRARFLHLRGSRDLAGKIGGELLCAITDCPILVILDKAGQRGWFQSLWNEIYGAPATERPLLLRRARELVKSETSGLNDALELLSAAISSGTLERFHLVMLDEADVVQLLDFDLIWPTSPSKRGPETWAQATKRSRSRNSGPLTQNAFKKWMADQGHPINTLTITNALETLTPLRIEEMVSRNPGLRRIKETLLAVTDQ